MAITEQQQAHLRLHALREHTDQSLLETLPPPDLVSQCSQSLHTQEREWQLLLVSALSERTTPTTKCPGYLGKEFRYMKLVPFTPAFLCSVPLQLKLIKS